MTKEVAQGIRRSQFVLTYGPGSLIETTDGPRLIPSVERGLMENFRQGGEILQEFEIKDSRLSIAVGSGSGVDSRIFSLPSNTALGRPENQGIYLTKAFPLWRICYGRKGKKPHAQQPMLYYAGPRGDPCPVCGTPEDSSAVRFVAACIDGHLDEVPWDFAVHNGDMCRQRYFNWKLVAVLFRRSLWSAKSAGRASQWRKFTV